MVSAKCAAEELGKIIKYSKKCRKRKNLAIFSVILMAAFGTKNVHSAVVGDMKKNLVQFDFNILPEYPKTNF